MKKLLFTICFVAIYSLSYSAQIIPHADLTYEGAFKLPNSTESDRCYQWNYVLGNLEFNPDGDTGSGSLYITGYKGCPTLSEISIPLEKDDTISNLNTATVITSGSTDFVDVGNGDWTGLPDGGTATYGPGDVVLLGTTPEKLLQVGHKTYITPFEYDYMLSAIDLDFGTAVNHAGWWKITTDGGATTEHIGLYQHFLFKVPSSYAATNFDGRDIIIGSNRQNAGGSYGASLFSLETWSTTPPADGTKLNATELCAYKDTTAQMDNYNFSNNPADMVWVSTGSKYAIVATFFNGARDRLSSETSTTDWWLHTSGWYYGNRHPEGIGAKGYHSEPYNYALLFYDPDDMAEVYAGTKDADTVQPYAIYNITGDFYDPLTPTVNNSKQSNGIAFDETNGTLYVGESAGGATGGAYVIHVYSVSSGTGSLDTTAPTNPSNLVLSDITSTNVTLTWTGSTDTTTNVAYLIYMNGYPVIRTTSTTYDYTYMDEWALGDDTVNGYDPITSFTFKVAAIDDYENLSGFSNEASTGEESTTSGDLPLFH